MGNAQRLLNGLDGSIGPVFSHGAVTRVNQALRETGFVLNQYSPINSGTPKNSWKGGLVIAPPSAQATPWVRKFQPYETAMASGWMMLRGTRRRRNIDRGFVLSDHTDWNGLLGAIKATGANKIFITHGYTDVFSRYLNESVITASVVKTLYQGELLMDNEEEIT